MQKSLLATITLEDGTILEGRSFGYPRNTSGELVFYTGMVGYVESLTDPSYKGQILVPTFPMIGNYGVPADELENGISKHYESEKIQASALIVADYSEAYSHWNASRSLGEWLWQEQIPAIEGIDTRALTQHLRDNGSQLCRIEIEGEEPLTEFYNPNIENLVSQVSIKEPVSYGDGELCVALVDCGVKNNIIRHLLQRGVRVVRLPWDYDFNSIDADGVFLSNGPGDPAVCAVTVEHLRTALAGERPIMGICLGNQLLARAAGASTYKMKYGHRSHNQAVIAPDSNRCFITSQNHGYAIDKATLPQEWAELFVNVDDNSNEGIKHRTKPFFSVQFHPEAASGPTDTEYLFDEFVESMRKYKLTK